MRHPLLFANCSWPSSPIGLLLFFTFSRLRSSVGVSALPQHAVALYAKPPLARIIDRNTVTWVLAVACAPMTTQN
jgi:hypothetical protein